MDEYTVNRTGMDNYGVRQTRSNVVQHPAIAARRMRGEKPYPLPTLGSLGADSSGSFFTDLYQAATEGYKQRQALKIAQAQARTAEAKAAQTQSFRGRSPSTPGLLGLPTTTWLMLAGAGLGAYLLLSRKKKRR